MRFSEYANHDATGLAALVAEGEVAPDELLDMALMRLEEVRGLGAVPLLQEGAARAAIRDGLPDGPLKGVPFLLKDLGAEAATHPSHQGSRLTESTEWPVDSAVFERLRAAGLVTFGRTAAPENGIGPVTEAAVYGAPTRNPWDTSRTPGGSSGGSGAAVAAGIVPAAHGSDGGGSVRIPASCCGLLGLKATRARLPDGPYAGEGWGGMAIEGFLTRSVRDTAALLDATAGPDLGSPYPPPPMTESFVAAIARPPRRLRVALCDTTFDGAPVHPDCAEAAGDAGRLLESLGHHVEPARPTANHADMMAAWTDIVACGTALTIRGALVKAGAVPRGAPLAEVERALPAGTVEGIARGALRHAATLSGADYLSAVNRIHAYGREMAAFLTEYDALLSPTLAEPPALLGRFAHDREDYVDYRTGPEGVFAYSPFCAAFNASGQPAASVPLHWAKGLPIGVHVALPFGADAELLSLCAELEAARPWFDRRPAAGIPA